MALTTQDLVKSIDITGLNVVTGSEINQLIDTGRLAADKGMIVETQDSALNTPVVPDPNHNYTGVVPIWWKRYLWRRLVHATDILTKARTYVWNPNRAVDAIYLQWELIDLDAATALANANQALIDAAAAQDTADIALSNAQTGITDAGVAQVTANSANATANATSAALTAIQTALNLLWSSGDIKATGSNKVYSNVADEGWLNADGQDVDRLVFAKLFAAIGVTFGPGNGTTTFTLPDLRGRTIIGAGTGAGLSLRALADKVGEENHLLTIAELPAHHHTRNATGVPEYNVTNLVPEAPGGWDGGPGGFHAVTNTGDTGGANAHQTMQPSLVLKYLIKT